MQHSWSTAVPRQRKVTAASVFVSAAALCHHQSPGTALSTLRELTLELADALGQAPGKTCKSGISEAFPSNSISFPLKNKNRKKRAHTLQRQNLK